MTFQMFVLWVLGGLLAGGLAWIALKRGGYGVIGDIILGLGGGVIGSWLFWALGISSEVGLLAMVAGALVAGAGMIVAQRQFWPVVG
jgi:uncharacterized membrane protein YeaQ/YmgE (transglycosylase-associated protein family)